MVLRIICTLFLLFTTACGESGARSTTVTDCVQARVTAAASSNGAQVVYCDDFSQSAGKLSTVSPMWIDQN